MKSPFPGMDPFIEARGLWPDFHHHLICDIKCALAEVAPERYVVRTGVRTYVVIVESEGKENHSIASDTPVTIPPDSSSSSPGNTVSPDAEPEADIEAVSIRAFVAEHFRETFVEIYETDPEMRLVTSIEVLSPSNKRRGTEGWELYQRKRQAHLLGAANLVEIDLLRGGHKLPMLDPWPKAPYTLLVCRRSRAPYCKVWPAHYRRPLPPIPVPLSSPDPDLTLSLQPMVEAIYARARYARSIDYSKPLDPPLTAAEQNWLAEQLQARQSPA